MLFKNRYPTLKLMFATLLLICNVMITVQITPTQSEALNDRPIIGIPTQKISDEMLLDKIPKLKGREYIAASYVKFVEMAGARVVAIPIKTNKTELKMLLKSVNGLLFPGGEANMKDSGYYKLTKYLFKEAVKINKRGKPFPILGICRGMQALVVHLTGKTDYMDEFDSVNLTAPLKWYTEELDRSFLKDIPPGMKKGAEDCKVNITGHFHKYGFSPDVFEEDKIKDEYEIIATSKDRDGKEFVSIFQGKKLPFYGLQFHPEKTLFEWAPTIHIPHSLQAIYFSQFLSNMYVAEVKRNTKNHFESMLDEQRFITLKDPAYYTGFLPQSHSPFMQIYVY